MAPPLKCTGTPGVHMRGSRWAAVYLENGRQRRRSAATFREALEITVRATAREATRRTGPGRRCTAMRLEWVDHHAGRGADDVINDRTRRELPAVADPVAATDARSEVDLRNLNPSGPHH